MADFNGCSKCLELSKNEQALKNKLIKKVRLVNLYRKYCQTYDIKKVKENSRDVSKNVETAISDANILRSRLNHFISENTELLKIKEEKCHQISQLEKQCQQAVDKSTHLAFINEQLVAYHTSHEDYFQKLKSHVKRLATHVLKNDPKNEEAKTCLKLAKKDRPSSIRSALKKGKRDINSDDQISTVHKDSEEDRKLSEKEPNLESVPVDREKEPFQNITQQSSIGDLESNCSPVSKVLSDSEYYSDEDFDSIPLKKTCVEACPDAENKAEENLNACNSIQEIQSASLNKDSSHETLSSEHFDLDGSHPDSVSNLLNSQSDRLPPEELFCSGNKDVTLFDFSSIDSNLQDTSFCKSSEEMSYYLVNGNSYKDNPKTTYFLPPLVDNSYEKNNVTLVDQMPCEESLDILDRSPSKPIEFNDGHNDLSILEDRIANTSRVSDIGKSSINTSYHHLNPDPGVISESNSLKVFENSHEQNSVIADTSHMPQDESFITFENSPSESIKLNDTSHELSIPKDKIANNSCVSDTRKSYLNPDPGVNSDRNSSKVFVNSYEQNSLTTDTSHMLCDESDTLEKRPSKSIKLNERSNDLTMPEETIANTSRLPEIGKSTVNTSCQHLNPNPDVISSSNSSNNNSHEQEKNEPDIHELDCAKVRKNPPNLSSVTSVISTTLEGNECTNGCLANNDVFEENITIEDDKHESGMETEFNPNQQQHNPNANINQHITGKIDSNDELKNETSAQNGNEVFSGHSLRENVPFGNNVFTPRYQLSPQDFIYACCSSKDHLYTDRATFFWNFKDNTSVQISVPIQRGNDKIGIKVNDADSGMDCYSAETSGSKMASKYSIIVDMNPDKVTSDLNCHCSIDSRTDRKNSVKSNDCRSCNSLRDGKERTSFRNVLIGNVHEKWHQWRTTQETSRFNGFSLGERVWNSSVFPRSSTKIDVEGLRHDFESISLQCSATIDISDPVRNESDSNPIFSITKKPLFYNPLNVSNTEISRTFGENSELVISKKTVATLRTSSFVCEQQKHNQVHEAGNQARLPSTIISDPKSRIQITKGTESLKPDNLDLNENSEKLSTRSKHLPSEKGLEREKELQEKEVLLEHIFNMYKHVKPLSPFRCSDNWREESLLMELTPENNENKNAEDKFIAGIVNQSQECTSKFIAESIFNSSRGETLEKKNDDKCSTSEGLVKLKEVDKQNGEMATTSYSPSDISFKSDDKGKGKNTLTSGMIDLLKDKGSDSPECEDSQKNIRANKNNLDLGEQNKSIFEKSNSLLPDSDNKSSDISNDSSITVSLTNSPVNLINGRKTRTRTKIPTPFKETKNIKHTTNEVNDNFKSHRNQKTNEITNEINDNNFKSHRNQKTNEIVKGVKHCLPGMLFDVVEKELTLQSMNSSKDKASLLERSQISATGENKVPSANPENKEIIPIKEKGVKIIKTRKATNKDNANTESKRTLKRKKCLILTDEDTDDISDSEPLSSTIKECLETNHSSEEHNNKKASLTMREKNNKILRKINDHSTKNTLNGNNCLMTSDDNNIDASYSEPISPAIKESLETSLSSEEHDNKNTSPSKTVKNNKILRDINDHITKNTLKRNNCLITSDDNNIDSTSNTKPLSPVIKESLETSLSSEEHDNKNASPLKIEKNNKSVITLRERNVHSNKYFLRRKNCLINSDDEDTDAISDSECLSPATKESLETSHSTEKHDNKNASPSKTEKNNKILREINDHDTKNTLIKNNCLITSDDNNIDSISDSKPLSPAMKESLETCLSSEENNKNASLLKTEKNNKIVITLRERNVHSNKYLLRRKNCLISSDDEDTDAISGSECLSPATKESLETSHSTEGLDNKIASPSKTEKNNKIVITLREKNGHNTKRFLRRKNCLINSDDEGTDAISNSKPPSPVIKESLRPSHSSEEYDNKKASSLIKSKKNNEIVKTLSDKNDHNTKTLKTKNTLNIKNCLGNSDDEDIDATSDSKPLTPVIKERLGASSFSEEYNNRMKDNKIVTILSEENQNTNNLESPNIFEKKYLIFSDDGDLDEYLESLPSVTKESPEISYSEKVKVELIEDNSLKTCENVKYQLKQEIQAIEKDLSVQELDKCKSKEAKIDVSPDSKLKNDFSKGDNTTLITSDIYCNSPKLPDEKGFNKQNVIDPFIKKQTVHPQFYVDSQLPKKSFTLKVEETNLINAKDIQPGNLSKNLHNFTYNKSAVKRCVSPTLRGFYADTSETISPSETASLSTQCKKEEQPCEKKMKLVTEEKEVNALMSKPNNTDDPSTTVFQVPNTLNGLNSNKRKNLELSDSSELLNKKLKLSETGVSEPKPLDLIECKQNFFICALNYSSSEVLSKGWREDEKPIVNKQTVSDIKYEIKRLIGAAEENLYEHLNKVVEPFIKSKVIEPRTFAKAIIELICEDKHDKLEEYPNIARIAKLCILFSISFIGSNKDFLMKTLRVLEEHLCAYHDRTLRVPDGVKLVTYYTALCKHYGMDMKGKQMIYDILYARHIKAYPMVFNILKIWPALLPKAFKCFAEDCLLTQTIVFILLGANRVCGEKFAKLYRFNNLYYFITKFYGYGQVKRRDELCEQIIKRISEKGSRMALILLAQCEGFEWAVTVVEKKLFPLLHAWLQNKLDRITAEEVIWTIGMVVRAFPLTKSSYFVKATLDLFEVILQQSPDEMFSETVIGAVSLLRRHNLMLCALILIKWIPKNKTVTKKTIEHARNILCVKNITHWKSFFSKQHKYTEAESFPT